MLAGCICVLGAKRKKERKRIVIVKEAFCSRNMNNLVRCFLTSSSRYQVTGRNSPLLDWEASSNNCKKYIYKNVARLILLFFQDVAPYSTEAVQPTYTSSRWVSALYTAWRSTHQLLSNKIRTPSLWIQTTRVSLAHQNCMGILSKLRFTGFNLCNQTAIIRSEWLTTLQLVPALYKSCRR